jgi:hypothetical protein
MSAKKNIGLPDRIVRIVIGVVLLASISFAFIGPKTPYAYLGLLGIIPLFAGISGYCPPYELMGINTYRKEKAANH